MRADSIDENAADICLLLEGTYPYVMGGVSSWVHQIIRELPELTFHLWFIGADSDSYSGEPLYDIPENVVGLDVVALHDRTPRPSTSTALAAWAELLPDFIAPLLGRGRGAFEAAARARARVAPPAVDLDSLFAHDRVWETLVALYEAEAPEESFQAFFWTFVNALRPVFSLLQAPIPEARAYHTVSTGFAGLLAARVKHELGRPMAITEHGIYTKERRIEVDHARWIHERPSRQSVVDRSTPYFRRFWTRHFQGMSDVAYAAADRILTLHQGNTALQIRDGADPRRLVVVPNGIDVERIAAARRAAPLRPASQPFTIGFVGRVAPIKDVETLLDAMALVRRECPEAVLRILGPFDEDREYHERCLRHSARLGIQDRVHFEGPVDVPAELPKLDALVLTSISEAQPLVILEAGAASLPVVATDVGACPELLLGRSREDRALGASGILTPIGSPAATAAALLRLARDPELRERMGTAGRRRVEAHYAQGGMIEAYRAEYTQLLWQEAPGGAGRAA